MVLTTVSSVVGSPSIPSESNLVDAATSLEEYPSDFMTFGKRCKVSKRSIALSIDWLTRFIAELTALKATAPTEKFLIASLIFSKPLAPWPALSPPALASSPAFLKPAPPPLASSPEAFTLCPACLKPSPPELASLLADLILLDACLKPSPDFWARSELSFTFSPACLNPAPERPASSELSLIFSPARLKPFPEWEATSELSLILSPARLKPLLDVSDSFAPSAIRSPARLKPCPALKALSPVAWIPSPALLTPWPDLRASVSKRFKSLDNSDSFLPLTWTSITILPSAIIHLPPFCLIYIYFVAVSFWPCTRYYRFLRVSKTVSLLIEIQPFPPAYRLVTR